MQKYSVISTMSGTSLDGLDIALCIFYFDSDKWNYKIIKANTYKYHNIWINKLKNAYKLDGLELIRLNKEYGKFIGNKINLFRKNIVENIDFIASHGHTVFHNPSEQITLQIGDGASISATSKLTTICDFRSVDVALMGQGAPLVPIGDEFLFNNYHYLLNIGGFANISFRQNNKRIAFDISPANIIINYLTQKHWNKDFDKDGNIAKKGKINYDLLELLNNIDFFKQKPPKSLGIEWLKEFYIPIINNFDIKKEDILRTIYENVAMQIAKYLQGTNKNALITGGGAKNNFLINRIQQYSDAELILPSEELIDYKEALIFAFLGILRYRNEINCIKSVTGAKQDSIGGCIYQFEKPATKDNAIYW